MFLGIINTEPDVHSHMEKRKLSAYLYDSDDDFRVPSLHSH